MAQFTNVSISVQKILCECCKKACSFIGRQNKDNVQLLSRINDYLYRKKESVEDILKETEKLRLHVENNPTEIDTLFVGNDWVRNSV